MPQTAAPLKHRLARCECGALQLHVTGAPVHVHGCACTKCQRLSGSALSLSAWFPETDVQIEGEYTRFYYNAVEEEAQMAGFCPTCGGGKFFRTGSYLEGCIGIAVGNFADPDFPMPDHIHWWPDRPRWLAAPANPPAGPELLSGN